MNEKQQLLAALNAIETDVIKEEKNFGFKTALIKIFKALHELFDNKSNLTEKDLVNEAQKQSRKLGLDGYDWNKIFNFKEADITEQKTNDNSYPENFSKGTAIDDGSCFFDSFRQGLEQQKEIKITVEQLRQDCKEFVSNNPPRWFVNGIGNDFDEVEGQFVNRGITPTQYAEVIENNDFWGRPEIEGRILCEKYDVKLHVIEKHTIEGQQLFSNQLISNEGSKSVEKVDYSDNNLVHIVNSGNQHFEPLLDRNKDIVKREIQKQQEEDYQLAKQLQEKEDYLLAREFQKEEDSSLAKQLQEQENRAHIERLQQQRTVANNLHQEKTDFALAKKLQTEEILKFLQVQKNSQLETQVREMFNKLLAERPNCEVRNVIKECIDHFQSQIKEVTPPSCRMAEVGVITHVSPQVGITV